MAESEQNPKRSKKLNPNLESANAEFWTSCEGKSAGAYLLLKHLSGFANSAVYTAVSGRDTQPFAIKLLRIDGAERERRLRAWSALVSLSHPNLIKVFEAGQCEIDGVSLLYLVMARADGDLAAVLAERPLTAVETHETLAPTLRALTYLQEQGYVYGGLRPSRVLAIGEEIKLASDCITRSGSAQDHRAGSVYDPPEWGKGTVSPEGDVWSLGATLVHALSQKSPRPDLGDADPVVPENLPEPFLTIARNCLRRNPKSRWSLAQIAAHLNGSQVDLPPAPTHTEPASRPTADALLLDCRGGSGVVRHLYPVLAQSNGFANPSAAGRGECLTPGRHRRNRLRRPTHPQRRRRQSRPHLRARQSTTPTIGLW